MKRGNTQSFETTNKRTLTLHSACAQYVRDNIPNAHAQEEIDKSVRRMAEMAETGVGCGRFSTL